MRPAQTTLSPHRKIRRKRGFSLPELVVASTISVGVVAFSGQLLITMLRSEARTNSRFVLSAETSRFLANFSRDIPSANGFDSIAEKSVTFTVTKLDEADRVISYRLVDPDPNDDDNFEILRRQREDGDGNVLEFNDISSRVSDFDIRYFDESRAVTDDADDVRFVQVYLQLSQRASGKVHNKEIVTPLTMLRNKTVAN